MTQPQVTTSLDEETKTQKEIVDALFLERDNYQQATANNRTELNEIHSAFMGQIDDAKDKSKSQEKIMKLRTEVNYIVPSIFSGSPELECTPIGEEDKDLAYVGEKIINHDLNNIPQAYEIIEAWVKQSVVFGTSILKVVWKMILEDNGDGTKTPVSDEPALELPNIVDCFYNPIISDVESQASLIFRTVLPISEVKDNPMYDAVGEDGQLNREKIAEKGTPGANQYDSSRQVSSDKINEQKASIGTIEIYDRVTDEGIQTVCDGKERLLLRDAKWEYDSKCSVKLIHEPADIPNRFDGLGVGHNTLGLSRMIQKLSNKLQDTVNMGNNPHFLGRKGAGIDKKQLVITAGGLTEVDGEGALQDQIQPLQVPDIKNGALELLNRFDDEHKRASGANDLIQGSASNKTLGQDQIASTYSSNRFELVNRRFKEALADVGRIILMMRIQNIQSIDDPILKIFPLEAEITDAGQIKYSRETVYQMLIAARQNKDLKFNIKVKGETNIAKNKQYTLKEFNEWLDRFLPLLPPQNQMECGKKWLEMAGIGEVDKLIPDMTQNPGVDPMTGQPIQQMPQGTAQTGMPPELFNYS
jgi:hypothetical protein